MTTFSLPLGLMLLIFWFSSLPGPQSGQTGGLLIDFDPQVQNLLHIPLFGLLQYLWLRAFWSVGKSGKNLFVICCGITVTYGFLDEFHQVFVPGRYASMVDVFFNLIGVFLGTLGFSSQIRFMQSKSLTKML